MNNFLSSALENLYRPFFGYNPKDFQFGPKPGPTELSLLRTKIRNSFQPPRKRQNVILGNGEGDYTKYVLIADSGAYQRYDYVPWTDSWNATRVTSFIHEESVSLDDFGSKYGRNVVHVKTVQPVNGEWQARPAPYHFYAKTREYNLSVCTPDTWYDRTSASPLGPAYDGYARCLQPNIYDARLSAITQMFQSGFEILPFAKELDSTVEMAFTRYKSVLALSKLKLHTKRVGPNGQLDKSLFSGNEERLAREAYAEMSWGWLPLVRDIPKLCKAVSMQMENVKRFGGEGNAVKINVGSTITDHASNGLGSNPYFVSGVGGKSRMSGYLTSRFGLGWNHPILKQFSLAADAIGFHPDLATAWEVFPASFIINEFVPIGDMLDKIHPRGWFHKGQTFTGWASEKIVFRANYRWMFYQQRPGSSWQYDWVNAYPHEGSVHTAYLRHFLRDVPVANWESQGNSGELIFDNVEWKAPEVKDFFNALVVAKLWSD